MSYIKYLQTLFILFALTSCNEVNKELITTTLHAEITKDESYLKEFEVVARDSTSLYSVDISKTVLYKLNNNFELVDSVGGKGFGPGEYSEISHVRTGETYLFVYDISRFSISVYNSDFHLVKSSVIEQRLLDFAAINDTILIGLLFDMDSWSIVQINNHQFDRPEYLHHRSVRSPELGVGRLRLNYPYLLICHIFTNSATVYNIETKSIHRITNPLLPQRPVMIETPLNPIPTDVVWSSGFLMDENLLQVVRNPETNKYSLYLISPKSRVLARFDLEEPAESIIFREDSIWTLSDSTVYKYSLDQLSL